MEVNQNRTAFFELLKAGLFPERQFEETNIQIFNDVEWEVVFRLAEEQAVVGVVTAGIDSLQVPIPQEWRLQFIGTTLQIEKQNKSMNEFVAWLVEYLRNKDVYTLLVKGQGIAKCYEKPLWRACGDVDLLLSDTNYVKAKLELMPIATNVEKEYRLLKHLGMVVNGFMVELHGTLRSRLTKRIDKEIDLVQDECFLNGEVRSVEFNNSRGTKVQVFLPSYNQDVVFIFTHILHHLFIEGIGLRQICDLYRLLWTYRGMMDLSRLEKHLQKMRLMTEWRTFGALAVEYLGIPKEAVPFYDSRFNAKGTGLMSFMLETGNLGHSRKNERGGTVQTLVRRAKDAFRLMRVFPVDAWKMYFSMIRTGLVLRAE